MRVASPRAACCSGRAWQGSWPTVASRSWQAPATPTTCSPGCRWTSRSSCSTSDSLPPTPTRVCAEHPAVALLGLFQYVEVGLAMKLLADSAQGVGYLLKDRIGDVEDSLRAVTRVGAVGSALDPTSVSTLLQRHRSADPLAQLTPGSERCSS